MSGFTEHLCEVTVGPGEERNRCNGSEEMKQKNAASAPGRGVVQYSSGSSNVVTERSASVMIQSFSVSETG